MRNTNEEWVHFRLFVPPFWQHWLLPQRLNLVVILEEIVEVKRPSYLGRFDCRNTTACCMTEKVGQVKMTGGIHNFVWIAPVLGKLLPRFVQVLMWILIYFKFSLAWSWLWIKKTFDDNTMAHVVIEWFVVVYEVYVFNLNKQ